MAGRSASGPGAAQRFFIRHLQCDPGDLVQELRGGGERARSDLMTISADEVRSKIHRGETERRDRERDERFRENHRERERDREERER